MLGPDGKPVSTAGAKDNAPQGAPKLHIDSDWKAQAQAEKERLAAKEQAREQSREAGVGKPRPAGRAAGGAPEELPPADFHTLVEVLASQALMGLGGYGDPKTGRVIVDLPGAKFSIDLLAVVEEKTRNNLSKEEADELRDVLAELRSRFVHFIDLVARQQAAGGAAAMADPGAAAAAAAQLRMPLDSPRP